MKYDTAQPYVASYVLVRDKGKVAFVLRANTSWMNNHYGLPSGKVEKGESFQQAAVREALEEIGIQVDPNDLSHALTMHRKEPGPQGLEWVDVFFEARKWSGDPRNAEPHMHSELAWLDLAALPDNTIPSLRFALDQLQAGNVYCEYGWE